MVKHFRSMTYPYLVWICAIIVESANIFSYQRSEKPLSFVSERESLKEKTMMYRMGR